MPTFTLFLRRSSRGSDHPGMLYLRVIHNRATKSSRIAGCRLFENEWDNARQVIINNDAARSDALLAIQEILDTQLQLIAGFAAALEKQGRYTVEDLMQAFRFKKDDGKLFDYTQILSREMEEVGQIRTARAYRTVALGLVKFNKGEDIPLEKINNRLIMNFEADLKSRGKLPNTISYYMRNLRAIFNKAVENRQVKPSEKKIFEGVFMGVTKSRKRALTIAEIQKLHDLDFDSLLLKHQAESKERHALNNLYTAWRLFFFCFHARGMSFVDMAFLKKESIRNGVLRYYRRKTGQLIEVKVTTAMRQIIDNFSKQVSNTPYLFPVIMDSNKSAYTQYESGMRMQNVRLKELGKMARIARPISSHVARHSWATIAKHQNQPIWVISEGLGHSSEKMTYTYLALFEQSVLDAANERIAEAITKVTGKLGITKRERLPKKSSNGDVRSKK